MNDAVRYTKAFAKALAEHLRGNTPAFTRHEYGAGGCESCGYGADEYEILDMDRLEAEIDKFTAEFAAKKAYRIVMQSKASASKNS